MTGAWLDGEIARGLAAAGVVIAWLGLCAATIGAERRRRRAAGASDGMAPRPGPHAGDDTPVLVAHATQTGHAEALARESTRLLRAQGVAAQCLSLADLKASRLQAGGVCLFVASTYGEGDAPDGAGDFIARLTDERASLATLSFAVLALGDRHYAHFCAFGHRLAGWLAERGASALASPIEIDHEDPGAWRRWQSLLAEIASSRASRDTSDGPRASSAAFDDTVTAPSSPSSPSSPSLPSLPSSPSLPWTAATPTAWTIVERERLNPANPAHPLYRIVLRPADSGPLPVWQAGDLAMVAAPADGGPARAYSIASLPADGVLTLIVRTTRRDDGSPGRVSGLLSGHDQPAPVREVAIALRENRSFHLTPNAGRPLILIGNGSGIAGLLALIAEAARAGRRDHWLLYGERDPIADRPADAMIDAWRADGTLSRVDRVFSRGTGGREYVQHRLVAQAGTLRERVAAGAAIYVCGSARGMADGVQQALVRILGDQRVRALREAGRYRRDVY